MKKIILTTAFLTSCLFANSEIYTNYIYKDYTNSKTKTKGKTFDYRFLHNFENSQITINFEDSLTKRENEITKVKLTSIEVEKLSFKYLYNLNENYSVKTSFLNIEDNLAPTDDGKVYGIGIINKNSFFDIKVDTYLSDYEDFNVNQYDLTFIKKFKIEEVNFQASLGTKYTNINGEKYGNYILKDKDFLSTFFNINGNYKGFIAGLGFVKGDRLFTVFDDGLKVEHHALRQNETYSLNLGKKFKHIDITARYIYSKGDELPENRDNVKSKFTSISVSYKF
ncbi:hypothetical protein [Arcobacter cloacae]|uniref:DUF2219 domain-containing protein n=1 Tax=Arcobacter cloacae TaxID=1054034 RepID=A0A4Q0ZI39_9BACT|nr:hypothetical protein [Arcobacter cloacae]RXJ84721.1 hypothetical protein CRU90_05025 [Arcobacter cloacae]